MKRKNLTINLGNIVLTDSQYEDLLSALQTTVESKVKPTAAPQKNPATKGLAPAAVTATISASFFNTNPGNSILKAKHNGSSQQLTQSGTLSFDNVRKGDIISIQGRSLGNSEISIDVPANPQQKKFTPGVFHFNFFIL